jgi:hypothetical protein
MKFYHNHLYSIVVLSFFMTFMANADRGKDMIGDVKVEVIYATNENLLSPDNSGKEVEPAMRERLRKEPRLNFKHYIKAGSDDKPLYRSYENWAQPLVPSDEVLLRFEAQARPSKEVTRLDIELWLSHKKILKTGAALSENKPLFILGPEWRSGKMILVIPLQCQL